MKIAAFLDGRPGHEKQTLGILKALSERTDIDVSEIRVTGRFKGSIKAISEFLSLNKSEKFDMAIGTGSSTHLCVLAARFFAGSRAVICMSPERFLLPFFDLCLVPVHDRTPESSNVFKTAGPPGVNLNKGLHEADSGLILLGGTDEKSHVWNSAAISDMVRELIKNSPEKRWTVSTSPRTPSDMEPVLSSICSYSGTGSTAEFRPFSSTPRGWLESMYDRCSTVWVTADSISMVYEALSAGCRVGIIPVEWNKKDGKFQRSMEFLLLKGLVSLYPDNPETDKEIEVFDEAGRCAMEIIRRWP